MAKDSCGFRLTRHRTSAAETPEALFRVLRKSADIPHLWSQQADILRNYMGHTNSPDVALELPTGSGKTLVGLLIGEFRRRTLRERIVYLCPTRQLGAQVAHQAEAYGIPVQLCIPPDYDGIDEYRLGERIAATTYSALFNNNPRFDSPQIILLDDAHAGGDYIANMWSLRLERDNYRDAIVALAELFLAEHSSAVLDRIADDDLPPYDRRDVELIPFSVCATLRHALVDIIDEHVDQQSKERYSWSKVRDHLDGCCVFMSHGEVMIRPLIPPTHTHRPFVGAAQRIFMSATLGYGGELERITGRHPIVRLPIPEGWDRFNTGRCLFLFPSSNFSQEESDELVTMSIGEAGRCVILTPSRFHLAHFEQLLDDAEITTFRSTDIEDGLDDFVDSEGAALLLANRYDGIDLPDDACRLLVLAGLPVGVNAWERFLFAHLGIESILADRIRTRFTQGVGRCCRNDADYAAVVILDQSLFDFCARGDNRGSLHPELQAEIQFGLDESRDRSAGDLLTLLKLFLKHEHEWDEVEEHLQAARDDYSREIGGSSNQLQELIRHEIAYSQALWQGDGSAAAHHARAMTDGLSTQVTLQPSVGR